MPPQSRWASTPRTDETVGVDLVALRKHTAIFAGSGSGKTVLIRRLVEECALRGVSSIVLDPNNDLARLGSAVAGAARAAGGAADDRRAQDYFANTEVRGLDAAPLHRTAAVVPAAARLRQRRSTTTTSSTRRSNRPVAALEPRAQIAGQTAKAATGRGRCCERRCSSTAGSPSPTLDGFIDVLADLPDGVSDLTERARRSPRDLAQNLRAAMVNDPMFGGTAQPVDPGRAADPVGRLPRPGVGDQHDRAAVRRRSGRASSTSCRWRCSPGSSATRPGTGRWAVCW